MATETYVAAAPRGMRNLRTGLMWDAAELYGFPHAGNTGTTGPLTPTAGPLTITAPGTVLENLDITGDVLFEETATGGIIRNCRITSGGFWPCRIYGNGGLVEDCEIIGNDNSQTSLLITTGTVRRSNFHGAGDGVRMETAGVFEDNYIHDMADFEGAHNDALELLPGSAGVASFTITGNTILNRIGQTSCIIMSSWGTNPDADTIISGNLLAGGGYTIYGATITDVVAGIHVVDNYFSTMFFPECGFYGPAVYWPTGANEWDNVWIDGPLIDQPVSL